MLLAVGLMTLVGHSPPSVLPINLGTGQQVLFVHLRPLNLNEGCDHRLQQMMVAARDQGLEPTYLSMAQPREAADLPINKSLCEEEVDQWLEGKRKAKPLILRTSRSLHDVRLDGVVEYNAGGAYCDAVLSVLNLLTRQYFAAIISPVWFWSHDAMT
eukprot:Hpha_TRINITY_DN25604_c0_g1::TRINITY_DN25604_c0_g1_i1::g.47337::m.47337